MLHLSRFLFKRYYLVSQDCPQDGNKFTAVEENSVTSIETVDQSSVELSNGSAIPLMTFRETRNDGDSSIDKRDDGCVEDCESFHPADLLSFAWQIARGMVSENTATFLCIQWKGKKKASQQQQQPLLNITRVVIGH